MKRRSSERIASDFIFLSIQIGICILIVHVLVSIYQSFPLILWPFFSIFLGFHMLRFLYRSTKAIIKDTTLDNLKSDGEFSYVKGISPEALTSAKNQVLLYLIVTALGIIGIISQVNYWNEDGKSRIGNIALFSILAAVPTVSLVLRGRKYK